MNCERCGKKVKGDFVKKLKKINREFDKNLEKCFENFKLKKKPKKLEKNILTFSELLKGEDWIFCIICMTILCHDCCRHPESGYCNGCIETLYKIYMSIVFLKLAKWGLI